MRRSELFALTTKESERDADCRSEDLAIRAGLIHNYGSGTFGFTNLGKRVLDNIEEVIREEMDKIAQEVLMNQLQNSRLWKMSGRWNNFEGDEFISFENRDGKEFTMAATHEEASVDLTRRYIRSYRDLDLAIYQIGRKFRDDRARNGLIRGKEFVMKDAYSFHADRESLRERYSEFIEAYRRIFERLGLDFTVVEADNGDMGGSKSHEFLAESDAGSDVYMKCDSDSCDYGTKDQDLDRCKECGSDLSETQGIEIGHCFGLGTKYSKSMDLKFSTEEGDRKLVQMACYGIGVSRLIATIIEQNNDRNGICWNSNLSAFDIAVIAAKDDEKVIEKSRETAELLENQGLEVLLYDGDTSAGEKFARSDLIGLRDRVIVGNSFLREGELDVEIESNSEVKEVLRRRNVEFN